MWSIETPFSVIFLPFPSTHSRWIISVPVNDCWSVAGSWHLLQSFSALLRCLNSLHVSVCKAGGWEGHPSDLSALFRCCVGMTSFDLLPEIWSWALWNSQEHISALPTAPYVPEPQHRYCPWQSVPSKAFPFATCLGY